MVVRSAQRKGYAGTLKDMLTNDGLSALLSFLRTRLQIEFSISHEPILVDITYPGESPAPTEPPAFLPRRKFTIVLPTIPRQSMRTAVDIDWTFPEDPWRRE